MLYPHMLLLSWIAPGGGRGIVTLDLLNCTEVRSVRSPTHPTAKDDIGTVAAQTQVNDQDDPGLGRSSSLFVDLALPFTPSSSFGSSSESPSSPIVLCASSPLFHSASLSSSHPLMISSPSCLASIPDFYTSSDSSPGLLSPPAMSSSLASTASLPSSPNQSSNNLGPGPSFHHFSFSRVFPVSTVVIILRLVYWSRLSILFLFMVSLVDGKLTPI